VLLAATRLQADWSQAMHAACRITTPAGHRGSGCAFHRDAQAVHVLTNAHVVAGHVRVEVEFWRYGYKSRPLGATVVFRDYRAGLDVAVLRVPLEAFGHYVPETIPLGDDPRVGQPIVTVGCPLGDWPALWHGHVEELRDATLWLRPGSRPLAGPERDMLRGRSGSAVLSGDARQIVGLLAWGDGRREMAGGIPVSRVSAALQRAAMCGEVAIDWRVHAGGTAPGSLTQYLAERSAGEQRLHTAPTSAPAQAAGRLVAVSTGAPAASSQAQCGPDGCWRPRPAEPRPAEPPNPWPGLPAPQPEATETWAALRATVAEHERRLAEAERYVRVLAELEPFYREVRAQWPALSAALQRIDPHLGARLVQMAEEYDRRLSALRGEVQQAQAQVQQVAGSVQQVQGEAGTLRRLVDDVAAQLARLRAESPDAEVMDLLAVAGRRVAAQRLRELLEDRLGEDRAARLLDAVEAYRTARRAGDTPPGAALSAAAEYVKALGLFGGLVALGLGIARSRIGSRSDARRAE
jgi:predicted  nucleic acid-binding Zn-ribbon protein